MGRGLGGKRILLEDSPSQCTKDCGIHHESSHDTTLVGSNDDALIDSFQFLDKTNNKHKKRKIYARRTLEADNSDTVGGNKEEEEEEETEKKNVIENDVNSFLDKLYRRNNQEEVEDQDNNKCKSTPSIFKILNGAYFSGEEDADGNDSVEHVGKSIYNNKRTMLIEQDDKDKIETHEKVESGEEDGDYSLLDTNDDNSIVTHHFHDLKNIGKSLQYQQQLEYLFDSDSSIFNQILNLNIESAKDSKLCQLLVKNRLSEIWSLLFDSITYNKKDSDAKELTHLRAHLLWNLNIPADDIPNRPQLIRFMKSLIVDTELPKSLTSRTKMVFHIKKIQQLTYKDFITNTTTLSNLQLLIKLWLRYVKFIRIDESMEDILSQLMGKVDKASPNSVDLMALLIQLVLKDHNDFQNPRTTFTMFHQFFYYNFSSMMNDTEFIQALFLLTNSSMPLDDKLNHYKIIYILQELLIDIKQKTQDPINNDLDTTDLFICKSALCLSLITHLEDRNVISELRDLINRDTMIKLINTDLDPILVGLHTLVMSILLIDFDKDKNDQTEFYLTVSKQLKNFRGLAITNPSICNEIDKLLDEKE